jgi:hypothetical protein
LSPRIIGQAFADNDSVIAHAEKQSSAPGVGKGYDVLVNSRGVVLFEFHSEPFALTDEELHMLGSAGIVCEGHFVFISVHSWFSGLASRPLVGGYWVTKMRAAGGFLNWIL